MKNESYWLFALSNDGLSHYTTAYSQRFINDKVEHEDDNFIIMSDGLLLNKEEFVGNVSGNITITQLLSNCFSNTSLIKRLIGPFVTVVYDKKRKEGIAFGNQTGDSSVFWGYNKTHDVLYLSNNFNVVFEKCQLSVLNEKAAHYLLTYGFIVDDSTIVDGIYRLQAGKLLRFNPEGVKVEQYHRFNFHDKREITLEEAVEKVDYLFRKAVKRCFDKDLEYGYTRHLADLSAGLDSRMTNVVAKELGYNNIINISFSQSGSDEQIIAQEVASKLGNPLYHRSLDDATFLYDIEDNVSEEYGMAFYHGITAGRQFIRMIDVNSFGVEHSGQIGDVVISQFFNKTTSVIDINNKRNSLLLPLRYKIETNQFGSNEEYAFYTRAFQGALSTHYTKSHYIYVLSPFLDPELISFCASLPDTIRASHRLYWNWIDKKYPEYGKIRSSRIRHYQGMGYSRFIELCYNKVIMRIKREVMKSSGIMGLLYPSYKINNMNPFQYWYDTKEELRDFIDNYYVKNIQLLHEYKLLSSECSKMHESSSVYDKLMCLSLLESVRCFCG